MGTSATVLAYKGVDLITLKILGEWKSNTVLESYINESFQNKKDISDLLSSSINPNKQVSTPSHNLLNDKNMKKKITYNVTSH